VKTYSIREVLQQVEHMPNAWFYLPNTGWTLDTLGAFSLDSQLVQATLDDYFTAFKYYYLNDAFIVVKPGDDS
jgi:hypothetical protein